ncbi:sporulation protein YunB [Paenibacillus sp. 481]|uniref:sporulation protein YunB n=1 Tax=Paenibacillus sp. 481 TaxID=2835869 RepID=UPI001E5C8AF3|nr:sporulation protein YunB [Paenibacillus sp. 481]
MSKWRPKGWRGGGTLLGQLLHAWKAGRTKRWGSSWRWPTRRNRVETVSSFKQQAKPRSPRWYSRPGKPRSKRKAWFIALVIFFFLSVQLFVYVDRHLRGPIMHLAKIRVKQIATQAINKAITNEVMKDRKIDKLVDWKTDSRGKVTSFVLNYNEHMRITADTVNIVQSSLKELGMINDHIPVGQALGSPLIASFGPRVPIKMEPHGVVKVDLKTRPINVGINMVLVEVYIKIVEEVSIVIPFDLEPEVVETEIPISYLLVVGDVPMYYYDGSGRPVGNNREQAPPLSLPMQPPAAGTDAHAGPPPAPSNESGGISNNSHPTTSHPATSVPSQSMHSTNLTSPTHSTNPTNSTSPTTMNPLGPIVVPQRPESQGSGDGGGANTEGFTPSNEGN